MHSGLFRQFLQLFGITRSKQWGYLDSFVRAWRLVEAIQSSWDHERMVVQEDEGFEAILEHFTLQSYDFAMNSQSMQNFAPSPH